MKDNKIEVGDVLYSYERYSMRKYTVAKVTAKQAVLSNGDRCSNVVETHTDFKGVTNLLVKRIGKYGYYNLPTPAIEAEYHAQNRKNRLHNLLINIKLENIPAEDHNSLITVLSKYVP